jgi:hypothetical protein
MSENMLRIGRKQKTYPIKKLDRFIILVVKLTDMNIFKDKSVRKGIIASLIAAIVFFIFLEPLMRLLWGLLNKYSSILYISFINEIYKSAAMGQRNNIDLFHFTFVMTFIVFGTYIMGEYVKIQRDGRLMSEDLEKTENIQEKVEKATNEREKLLKKIGKLEKSIKVLEHIIVKGRFFIYIFVLFVAFASIFKSYIEIQLNTTFNQRLNALGIVIDESQRKSLISRWALMESRSDYLVIKLSIEKIAQVNNIKLPKALVK